MPKFIDIPQLTQQSNYRVNVSWAYLESWIEQETNLPEGFAKLDFNPDFQRGHVWTEDQQRAYVEHILRGGFASKTILFNCVGWGKNYKGPFVIVDGKQRLTAVRKFLANELSIFGGNYYKDYTDRLPMEAGFIICVNNLPTTAAVLKWYLELNEGGTPHTEAELSKVRQMLSSTVSSQRD